MSKILFCSDFYCGSYSTDRFIVESLRSLGHKVDTVGERGELNQKGYDYFFYMGANGPNVHFDIPTVYITLDLELGLTRGFSILAQPQWHYDYVFSSDGGHENEFKALKINHHWFPAGIGDDECVLGEYKKEFDHDVVFVGQYHYLPEWHYRTELVDFLKQTYGDRFGLYPKKGIITGKEIADLFASSKIVIGDSIYSPYYWSNRIYETMGRGGFIIHPRIEGLEKEFAYGEEMVPYDFGDFDGLKKKIDYYLVHDKERNEIRLKGYEKVKNNYTFQKRMEYVMKLL